MKKNIYIVLFGLLLSMGVVSCDNNSELLFDETAAQRKEGAIIEYNDALKSSEQGWLFQYFPEETQRYGGYNYVVKFNQHDSVTVWFENMEDLTKPETSFYDVINYGGPVLTFDTYNSLMHHFANPSQAEYLGKGGDFDFLIMSNENDVITLKGVKTGNVLRMTKMTESADAYLQKVKPVSDLFTGSSFESTIKETKMIISINDHRLIFNYSENEEFKSEEAPFITTPTGIDFYEPLTILGITVESLTVNFETNQLVSEDGKIVIDILQVPVDLTTDYWIINTTEEADRSDAVQNAWDAADAANSLPFPLGTNIFLGKTIYNNNPPGLSLSISPYGALYTLRFDAIKGHSDYINLSKVKEGANWSFVPFFNPLLNLIVDNAPYVVEMDDADTPTVVKMTSVANPDVWFVLRK